MVGQLGKVQPGEGRSLGAETSTVIDRTRCLVAPKVFGFQARSGPSWQARVSNSIMWTQTHRQSLEWQRVLLKLLTQKHTDTDSVAGAEVQSGSGRVSNLIRSNPKRELVQVQAAATLQASKHPVQPGRLQ